MKIALITSSYPRFEGDGTAPFIQAIAEGLVKLGHDVVALAPHDPAVRATETHGVRLQRFRYTWRDNWHIMGHARALESDVRLQPLAIFLLPFFVVSAFFHLWRITSRQKSDVIYAHWVLPNGLPAALVAWLRHIPLVISLHGSDVYVANKNAIYRAVAGWVFRRAKAVTACSPELKEKALDAGAPAHTILLPYGVDPQRFHPDMRKNNRQMEPTISAIGRMVYKKGFNVLVAALPEVLSAHPRARVVIGGEGPVLEELKRQAEQLGVNGSLSFPGRIPWDQAPAFLAGADVFVLPSVRDQAGNVDGLPNVLLEAMACGCPVVASRISGVPLVIEDGVQGVLVPPNDPAALACALNRLLDDAQLLERLGQAARQRVERELGWEQICRRISRILEEVH